MADLKVNDVVVYIEHQGAHVLVRNALVHIIFADNGMPWLTLAYVRSSEHGVVEKMMVPHRTRVTNEKGFYILPSETWP
jgi:hypothetical protein